ncbi:MAG: HAD family hydrolase [Bdellovibrionota bacterium]
MKVILFDIDGTLLLDGGAGGRACDRAFGERFGVMDASKDVPKAGRSDQAIMQEAAGLALGRELLPEEMEGLSALAHQYLAEELVLSQSFRLLPGAKDLCEALGADDSLLVGLQTGNLERFAGCKLKHGGIHHLFRFGGFGCDHRERKEIVRAAIGRAAEKIGSRPSGSEIFVIGDTPHDIEAGKANGARTIAVSTGIYSMEQLLSSEPDVILEKLPQPAEFEAIIRV